MTKTSKRNSNQGWRKTRKYAKGKIVKKKTTKQQPSPLGYDKPVIRTFVPKSERKSSSKDFLFVEKCVEKAEVTPNQLEENPTDAIPWVGYKKKWTVGPKDDNVLFFKPPHFHSEEDEQYLYNLMEEEIVNIRKKNNERKIDITTINNACEMWTDERAVFSLGDKVQQFKNTKMLPTPETPDSTKKLVICCG